MPLASRDGLVCSLDELGLLNSSQRADLQRDLLSRFAEPKALAAEMLRRGWLNSYQVNVLLQGRAADLVLGAYLIEERLGEGGTGQVFKARHRHMNRVVALKVIRSELTADPSVVARFYREIQVISQLAHPHIVHAFDAGPVGSKHLLIMEYVEGVDLARLIKQAGPLSVNLACDYVRQTALGLQHAHEKGFIHRDIKPSNLLLARSRKTQVKSPPAQPAQGIIKVLDLGLARLQCNVNGERTSTLTHVGAEMMGTPDYLAPEQALDFHQVDIRADIYGLGCTLFYLLTGQPPFPGGTLAQKIMRHQQAPPPAVETLRPDVPPGLAVVLRRMLAKLPADRFSAPAEVAAAMSTFAAVDGDRTSVIGRPAPLAAALTETVSDTGTGFTVHRGAPPARQRRRLLVAGMGVVALALLVVGVVVLGSRGRSGDDIAAEAATRNNAPRATDDGKARPLPVGKVLVLDDCQTEVQNWWPWSGDGKASATRTWVMPGKVGKHALQFDFGKAPAARPIGMNFEVAPKLRDWSPYRQLYFWFRGTGSGETVGINLNGNERHWSVRDDVAGWREIRAPLANFHKPNGQGDAKPEEFRAITRVVFVLYTAAQGSFQLDQLELLE